MKALAVLDMYTAMDLAREGYDKKIADDREREMKNRQGRHR
jgi:hypothetical protein